MSTPADPYEPRQAQPDTSVLGGAPAAEHLSSVAAHATPSPGAADSVAPLDQRLNEALAAAQHAAFAAAAEVACLLQRGLRLTGEPLYQAVYTQALCTWWEQTGEQVGNEHVEAGHALRRVRSWARTYLIAEIGFARPGTMFDHALAHAARAAARRFLAATGELLTDPVTRADNIATGPDAATGLSSGTTA